MPQHLYPRAEEEDEDPPISLYAPSSTAQDLY
jgi:hypothetical protein